MTFDDVRWVWMNGEVVQAGTADFQASISEAIRCYDTAEGPAVFRLEEHIDRLFRSAELHGVKIPYLRNELGSAVCQVIEANRVSSCYLRPAVFFGNGNGGSRRRPPDVAVLTWASTPLTDDTASAADASAANVFVVLRDGRIRTGDTQHSPLLNIARDTVTVVARDLGYVVEYGELTLDDLANAEEVFTTGSAGDVMPIHDGEGQPGDVTRDIQRAVAELVAGRSPRYRKWLHFVDECWLTGAYSALPCI